MSDLCPWLLDHCNCLIFGGRAKIVSKTTFRYSMFFVSQLIPNSNNLSVIVEQTQRILPMFANEHSWINRCMFDCWSRSRFWARKFKTHWAFKPFSAHQFPFAHSINNPHRFSIILTSVSRAYHAAFYICCRHVITCALLQEWSLMRGTARPGRKISWKEWWSLETLFLSPLQGQSQTLSWAFRAARYSDWEVWYLSVHSVSTFSKASQTRVQLDIAGFETSDSVILCHTSRQRQSAIRFNTDIVKTLWKKNWRKATKDAGFVNSWMLWNTDMTL